MSSSLNDAAQRRALRKRTDGICDSVLEAIGGTPLVALDRLCADLDGRILAKLDYLNPGHSKKDRIALAMVREAERSGALVPGQTVVELTSGSTGTGLALVCAITRHPFVAVMSRGNSMERARMMRALGAEVVLVEQAPRSARGQVSGADLDLVEHVAQKVARERRAFRADQFELPACVDAHATTTAQEILCQSGGRITAFCDFVGSGSTFSGCALAFKDRDPSIACYVVEPSGAAALAGRTVVSPMHRIQGGGYSRRHLPHLRVELVDGYVEVSDQVAVATTRELARVEGVFAGFSSGAVVAAARQLLEGPCHGGVIAVVLADSGMKYFSTELWENTNSS